MQGTQEAKSGITTSALSIFAGTVQAGWDKDNYSWSTSATVSSGTLKVSESAGGWFALAHLAHLAHLASNGQIANITLAPYAALSFDISAIPAGLTCQLQSGSGQNANTPQHRHSERSQGAMGQEYLPPTMMASAKSERLSLFRSKQIEATQCLGELET